MHYRDVAKDVLKQEIKSLEQLESAFDESFESFVSYLDKCRGTIIWSGVGKSGHICRKIVATMQSLGIKSSFLHPVDGLHGDIGGITPDDIVVLVSNSGETKEILEIITSIKKIGAKLFSIVGRSNSTMEHHSDKTIVINGIHEAFLDLVPTSSTTDVLVLGDAIAISIAKKRGFDKKQFGLNHPSGQLGKKLTLCVKDIMIKGSDNSVVVEGSTLEEAVFEMCKKSVSAVTIVGKNGKLKGFFTDGDLRRYSDRPHPDFCDVIIDDLMVRTPICLSDTDLLINAIKSVMSKHTVSTYPVINNKGKVVGTVRMVDVVRSGLYQ